MFFLQLRSKSPVDVYEQGYRSALEKFGLWDVVCVDNGKEADLMVIVQKYLWQGLRREGVELHAVERGSARDNRTVEQSWRDCNQEVTLPLDFAIRQWEELNQMDLNNFIHLFAVHYVLGEFLFYRVKNFVRGMSYLKASSRRSIPQDIATKDNNCQPMKRRDIPSVEEALELYKITTGSELLDEKVSVSDPLEGYLLLQQQRDIQLNLTDDVVEKISKDMNLSKNFSLFHEKLCDSIFIHERLVRSIFEGNYEMRQEMKL